MSVETNRTYTAKMWKVVCLREVAIDKPLCDCPEACLTYWKQAIVTDERFSPETEGFYVIMVNTRRKAIGYVKVADGTKDTLLVAAPEVFRAAVVASAAAVVLLHNHPSGDPTPSEADIKATRDLVRAGQLLKVEVLDHLVIGDNEGGRKEYCSLRELGYFSGF